VERGFLFRPKTAVPAQWSVLSFQRSKVPRSLTPPGRLVARKSRDFRPPELRLIAVPIGETASLSNQTIVRLPLSFQNLMTPDPPRLFALHQRSRYIRVSDQCIRVADHRAELTSRGNLGTVVVRSDIRM